MKENKFDELNTILGASHMTIVSIVNMAIRKKSTSRRRSGQMCASGAMRYVTR